MWPEGRFCGVRSVNSVGPVLWPRSPDSATSPYTGHHSSLNSRAGAGVGTGFFRAYSRNLVGWALKEIPSSPKNS